VALPVPVPVPVPVLVFVLVLVFVFVLVLGNRLVITHGGRLHATGISQEEGDKQQDLQHPYGKEQREGDLFCERE
jgi:hypothetical protein